MVEAATQFKRAGFSEEDSANLAQYAAMLQNVSDGNLEVGESAEFIISQMKAYGMEVEDTEHILNAVNEVAANFAISTNDLTTNISKASAALAVGNNTYEESIGLFTAGYEITRQASRTARGLVSIQSRLNQVVDESSATGQALTEWYKQHNIAIYDQEGQLKSLYDVLGQVAEIWPELTTNEKDYYLNQQAGANQTQNLAAILSNFKTAIDATATAYDSAGSAARQNEIQLESLTSKTELLKAAWEDFANNVVTKDMIANVLEGLTKLVEFVNSDLGVAFARIILSGGVIIGGIGIAIPLITNLVKSFSSLKLAALSVLGYGGASASSVPLLQVLKMLLPYAAQIGIVVTAIAGVVKVVKENSKTLEDFNIEISEANQELQTNKQRLEEINSIPWSERTSEIIAEKAEIENENAELEKNISLLKQRELRSAVRATRKKTYGYETTGEDGGKLYTSYAGVEYTDVLAKSGEEYIDILARQNELTDEQNVAFKEWNTKAGERVAYLKLMQEQGVQLTDEEKRLITVYEDANNAYDKAVNYISNYVSALQKQAEQAGLTGQAMYDSVIKSITDANNTQLDMNQQIQALIQLAKAAGVASDALAYANKIANGDYLAITSTIANYGSIGNYFSALIGGYVSNTSGYSGSSSTVSSDKQLKTLQNQLKAVENRIDAINDKYDAQVKALEEENELVDEQLKLQEALDALATAQSKKQMVYKDGRFQYLSDVDAVAEARKNLSEVRREQQLNELKRQIEDDREAELATWEEQKAKLEIQINKLQGIDIDLVSGVNTIESTLEEISSKIGGSSSLKSSSSSSKSSSSSSYSSDKDVKTKSTSVLDDKAIIASSAKNTVTKYTSPSTIKSDLSSGVIKNYLAEEISSKSTSGAKKYTYTNPSTIKSDLSSGILKSYLGYANGTTSSQGGLSLVGEQGAELRVLNQGDGIIPADITKNLMAWGSVTPSSLLGALGYSGNSGTVISVANVTLPNVSNAQEFVSGLKNMAYQRAYKRV